VECSVGALEEEEEKTVFALMSSKRQREYRIGTKVNTSGQAVKFPLEDNKHIRNHLIQIMENGEKLEHRGLKALPYRMDEDELISDYMDLPLFEEGMQICSGSCGISCWSRLRSHPIQWSRRNVLYMSWRWIVMKKEKIMGKY